MYYSILLVGEPLHQALLNSGLEDPDRIPSQMLFYISTLSLFHSRWAWLLASLNGAKQRNNSQKMNADC